MNNRGLGMTEAQVLEQGYQYARQLEDGTWMAVAQMFTNGRLFFNLDRSGFEAAYCYRTVAEALAAMKAFDPEWFDEPQGWHKCATDNRIRPDGDATRETIGYPPPTKP